MTASAAFVRIERLVKRFDARQSGAPAAVDGVTLDIHRGEIFCLLGASGCGKTTLLRMLAGFERPDSGHVFIDDADMTDVPPYERPVNMMFQSYALFPHMTVERNVAFGLEQEKLAKGEIARRVGEMLELVRLEGLQARKPHQLSGGQRQRVALARALVKRPKLLLLDEPLAALDRKLREHTQSELLNIQKKLGVTFVVVTHDQEEAMRLATRVGVMDRGRIVQTGTPFDVYEHPNCRFVADFIGEANFFEARVTGKRGEIIDVHCEALGGLVSGFFVPPEQRDLAAPGVAASLALRPEKIEIGRAPLPAMANVLRGAVEEIAFKGNTSVYSVRLDGGGRIRVSEPNTLHHPDARIALGSTVWMHWHPSNMVLLIQ